MEGLTSMSLLFIYRKSQKSQHKSGIWDKAVPHGVWRIGPGLSSNPARSWANILSSPGCEVMMLTSQTGILMLVWLQSQHFKEKQEGPVSLNLKLISQEMYFLSQKMILPSQISSIFLTAGLESNAGKQRKAHPPKNSARCQECVFIFFTFASFHLDSVLNTFLSILSLKIKLYLRGLKTE